MIIVPGDICQQFTREMFDMYQGFAAYKNWDFEVLNYTNAEYGELGIYLDVGCLSVSGRILLHSGGTKIQRDTGSALERFWLFFFLTKRHICLVSAPTLSPSGGLHHAAARIAGENVYKRLKHEGGTHRVQRIPEVGLSSRMQRIHTGTMTVIVLPQPEEVGSFPLCPPSPALSPLTLCS